MTHLLSQGRGSAARRMSTAAVIATCLAMPLTVATPAHASWHSAYTTVADVAVRDCYHPEPQPPSQYCNLQKRLPQGTSLHVVCQRQGQNIYGNVWWDYVVHSAGEGYASDYYVYTGVDGRHPNIDLCQ
ncbi:hypothetical protein AB0M43_06915 [Longispora sp. NPDC051575]|uniref:hypothetical protein n=1 Tax=Longispora sp. NPDC051575 TaxID=3154943 RepID=UPI003434E323